MIFKHEKGKRIKKIEFKHRKDVLTVFFIKQKFIF